MPDLAEELKMQIEQHLRIPGPTPVPSRVLRAMSKPMINHRGPEFAELLNEISTGLKQVYQTLNDIVIYPASGTGAMEAAITNCLSPGDKILSASCGVFGDRFTEIAQAFGANVEVIKSPPGKAVDPKEIAQKLEDDNKLEIKAVLVTHNETSTGVTNDLEAIAKAAGNHPCLLIVDAISSLGAIDLQTDNWKIDLVVSASQKALMCPPGLAFVSVSGKAWNSKGKMPNYYWSFESAKKYLQKGQTPYTPAVSQFYALKESLRIIKEEGLENIFERHKRLASAFRAGVKAMGLELFAQENPSDVITAIKVPFDVDVSKLISTMRKKYGIILAGGQKDLQGKIFRVGHVGYVSELDILETLSALQIALNECGHRTESGIEAATEFL